MTSRLFPRFIISIGIGVLALGYAGLPGPVGRLDAQGRGGPGQGGVQPTLELVARFDKNGDKRLDASERQAAKEYVRSQGLGRGGRGAGAVTPGAAIAKTSIRPVPASVSFYDAGTLRTLFFDFEDKDWEDQLMAFKDSDVEVPATLTIDGKAYKDVGIRFRGSSSFFMVPEGLKHSLNVTMDFVNKDQQVGGYNSLNLLNAHSDPTFLRSVLFLDVARQYVPAAQANFVRVVINGESWGVYTNVQQTDKTFLEQQFKTREGTRWKVPGSPGGRGGLEYLGEDVEAYKRLFEIKGNDNNRTWAALINLAKVLNQTPPDRLEAALAPILDVDEVLRFLALDNAFVNNDGYWVRASDYTIYLDPAGKFHLIPHDTNETFTVGGGGGGGGRGRPGGPGGPAGAAPGGPAPGGRGGGGRGGGSGNVSLDPLIGLDDASKPLRSKLLAVPSVRAKYLAYTRDMATKWMDWTKLEPLVTKYRALIAADVKADTRKIGTLEEFDAGPSVLKTFADQRRAFLLSYTPQ